MFTTFRRLQVAVAVEGCCHGDLDAIYSAISSLEEKNHYKVDLLLVCGDFQAVRNWTDLECMAVPHKYKELKDFYKYYSGEKTAPIPTIVIGGNHEASNYMHELYHGGWLAPNIYFLGHAGSIIVNGIRISGASGIFAAYDFRQGLSEKLPYDKGTMRSIYHTREFCVRRLSLLPKPQIFLSHDWPVDITSFGTSHSTPELSLQSLLRIKPFFKKDIQTGNLGSQPAMGLLSRLKPEWWFSAHLHVRFEATVIHEADGSLSPPGVQRAAPLQVERNPDEIVIDDEDEETTAEAPAPGPSASSGEAGRNPDEIVMDEEESDVAPPPEQPKAPIATTRFLALDKCLPRRQFLEVIDISPPLPGSEPTIPASTHSPPSNEERQPVTFYFDPHWLAITRAFQPYLSTTRNQRPFPATEADAVALVDKELEWVLANVPKKLGAVGGSGNELESWEIRRCQEFERTAPVEENPGNGKSMPRGITQPPWYQNPQTTAFCEMLEIEDRIAVEGCCHGDLDKIYSFIAGLEEKNNYKVDLLLICGDFQAVRNYADLECMACPPKYKALEQFYKYYSGEKVAPIPTILIGGNHEAANYMHELFHGGWVAPNMYFLGNGGSIIVNGIRISGISGIFASRDYKLGLYEKMPFNNGTMRSIYHIREFSVRRLSMMPRSQVFLSHDWPSGITSFGTSHSTPELSAEALFKVKPHFKESVQNGTLGSETLMAMLKRLKPEWWFAAHMHVRFEATVVHESNATKSKASGQGTTSSQAQAPHQPTTSSQQPKAPSTTKFLALDQCLPRRWFLQVVDISPPPPGSDPSIPASTYPSSATSTSNEDRQPVTFYFDPHWLAITRVFQPYLSTTRAQRPPLPKPHEAIGLIKKELKWVRENIPKKLGAAGGSENTSESWEINRCQTFVRTAPIEQNPGDGKSIPRGISQPPWYPNPQTKAFCEMLEIEDRVNNHQTES